MSGVNIVLLSGGYCVQNVSLLLNKILSCVCCSKEMSALVKSRVNSAVKKIGELIQSSTVITLKYRMFINLNCGFKISQV